ncbi:MAG: hypothetical protein V4447_12160 [Pseudomonadota bacterium]
MKTPRRFISICKQITEWLATLVFGGLTLLMMLYYAEINNPAMHITRLQRGIEILAQVSQIVACMAAMHLNLPLHL